MGMIASIETLIIRPHNDQGVALYLDVMPLIEPGTVDLILADLPYGTTECPWDPVIPFGPLWAAYERVLAPGGVIALTCAEPFTSALIKSKLRWFRYRWTWDKVTGSPGS